MRLVAVCPSDRSHNEFLTTAHVTETWVVDRYGDFESKLESDAGEVIHAPDPEDIWQCRICGKDAVFVEE